MKRRKGQANLELNRRILAESTVCHICGHDGADAVDHVIPIAAGGSDGRENRRPAHHNKPCPDCGRRCNREKAGRIVPNIIRRSSSLRRPGPSIRES